MIITEEVWKDILGYEGLYQISSLGRVKSFHRNKPLILSLKKTSLGYLDVTLSKNGVKKSFRVNRLVAIAFIPNLENKPQVNHIDENKLNNKVSNLEWVTSKENINHGTWKKRMVTTKTENRISGGLRPFRSVKGTSLKTGEEIFFISTSEAEKTGNFDHSAISKSCRGIQSSHNGYKWEYLEKDDEILEK